MPTKSFREMTVAQRRRHSLQRKTLYVVLLMTTVLGITSILIGYRMYASEMDLKYVDNTVGLAKATAALLDREKIRRYADEVWSIYRSCPWEQRVSAIMTDREEYLTDRPDVLAMDMDAVCREYLRKFDRVRDEGWEELRRDLQVVQSQNGLESLYVVHLDREAGLIVYIVDSDDSETYCPPGALDTVTDEDIAAFTDGAASVVYTDTESFGWLSSGGAPLTDDDGEVYGFVLVDISMDDVMRERHQFLLLYCAAVGAIILVSSLVANYALDHAVVLPVNKLAAAASDYAKRRRSGDRGPVFHGLDIHTRDEIENLYLVMRDMEGELAEYIEDLTRVTAEKERIGAELDVATKIQSDLLPSIFPPYPDRPEFDIYATMSPAKEVGGDFYDFFFIDHDHIAMVAADVSGKGVPAALFMVIAKTLIKNQTQLEGPGASPAHILAAVNDQLCENNDADMFVTVWLGILEIPTGRIRAANAGHENPFLRRADGTFEMVRDRHGLALAAMPGMRYRDYELHVDPGGGLFTYTDGVTEATSAEDELFGVDRLSSALNEDPGARAKRVTQIVRARIDGFVRDAPQFDDITMLCLEYRGGPET